MKRIAYVIAGASALGLGLAGGVLAHERVLEDRTSAPVVPGSSYPLNVEPRPGECVTLGTFTYGNDATGAATALGAVRKAHPDIAALREQPLDVGAKILERFESAKRVAAYEVRTIPGTRGGWLLTKEAYSWPCGAHDPSIPPPGKEPPLRQ